MIIYERVRGLKGVGMVPLLGSPLSQGGGHGGTAMSGSRVRELLEGRLRDLSVMLRH